MTSNDQPGRKPATVTKPVARARNPRRIPGRVIFWIGLVLVLLISTFVMVRIVQVSGPRPDPSTIPERPGR